MSIRTKPSGAGLVLVLLLAGSARSQPLRLSAEVQSGLSQFEAAASKLGQAKLAAAALAAGDRPRGSARDWEGLAEGFQAAARGLQRAEGPVLPDLPAPVPLAELKSCATRGGAVTRGDRAVRGLQAVAQRCAETRGVLRERMAVVQGVEAEWRALVKAVAALPEGSGVGSYFPGRLGGQEAAVAAALQALREGLARQSVLVERAQADLRARAGTLGAAVGEASRAKDCQLAGRWAGVTKHRGTASGMTLELTSEDSAWGGSANLGGVRVPVRSVTVNGTSVVVQLGEGHALSGTVTADGRSFTGTHSSSEGPASFALQRQ